MQCIDKYTRITEYIHRAKERMMMMMMVMMTQNLCMLTGNNAPFERAKTTPATSTKLQKGKITYSYISFNLIQADEGQHLEEKTLFTGSIVVNTSTTIVCL